jgi:hypothetical protein
MSGVKELSTGCSRPPKVVLDIPFIPLKIHTLWSQETAPENDWTGFV